MRASLPRALLLSALALASVASADSTVPPPGLRDVGIEQRLDQALPLDLVFRDESDNPVKLGDFFGQKPVLLSFVYYHCPMLCPMALEAQDRRVVWARSRGRRLAFPRRRG
jgi:cytochrome oxidase Cu insertion factor (SCO1/SenC/PrrC family)